MLMRMVFVIVDMLMSVHGGLVAVFVAAVAVSHFLMFVLMDMLVLRLMLVGMMSLAMGVLMSMHHGLVGVFMAVVAVGHFLMGVLMLVLVFIRAHGLSLLIYFAAGQSVNCTQSTAPYSASFLLPSVCLMAFFSSFKAEKPHQPAWGTAKVKTPFLSVLTTWVTK